MATSTEQRMHRETINYKIACKSYTWMHQIATFYIDIFWGVPLPRPHPLRRLRRLNSHALGDRSAHLFFCNSTTGAEGLWVLYAVLRNLEIYELLIFSFSSRTKAKYSMDMMTSSPTIYAMASTFSPNRSPWANIPCLQARTCLEIRNPCLIDRTSVLEILTMFHHCCATRCHIFRPKCMCEIRFQLGLRPRRHWGSSQRSQDPLTVCKGSYF